MHRVKFFKVYTFSMYPFFVALELNSPVNSSLWSTSFRKFHSLILGSLDKFTSKEHFLSFHFTFMTSKVRWSMIFNYLGSKDAYSRQKFSVFKHGTNLFWYVSNKSVYLLVIHLSASSISGSTVCLAWSRTRFLFWAFSWRKNITILLLTSTLRMSSSSSLSSDFFPLTSSN